MMRALVHKILPQQHGFTQYTHLVKPAGDVSHKPGGRLSLLSTKPAVTLTTLNRAATNFALFGEQRHDGCEQFA